MEAAFVVHTWWNGSADGLWIWVDNHEFTRNVSLLGTMNA
jgi:hypothetical protein